MVINEVPREERLVLLKKYAQYDARKQESDYNYALALNGYLPKILEEYHYSEFIEGINKYSDDFVFRLLEFVSTSFIHSEEVALPEYRRMVDIIAASKLNGGRTNSRGLSIILAELLRINRIKARHVTCKPFEDPCVDCHVVVDCILPSGRRIMLDPTYNLYLKDDRDRYVSLKQLREGIIAGSKFVPNPNAAYNGGAFDFEKYIRHMVKNSIRFTSNIVLGDVHIENDLSEVELIPAGYPTNGFPHHKRFVYNLDKFWNIGM